MATPTLPSDVIIDILTRSQSKTLIRFKSVSKQWYSLINSPDFVNLHLSQTLISQNPLNLIVSESSLFFFLISDNYTNPNLYFSELDHPLKHLSETSDWLPQILGSINGVLCIALYDKSSVVLYNPSNKTHRFIPPFTPSPNTNPHFEIKPEGNTINIVVFGFGFDSVSGDYKVLRIIETLKNRVMVYREASVYSLSSDSWKCVKLCPKTDGYLTDCRSAAVLVNEALHFIVLDAKFNPKALHFIVL